MPRIAESNPRYRSKSCLVRELVTVLNSDLHFGTKFAVLYEATWVWSEFDGKYSGCRYWSSKALMNPKNFGNLRHEHAVPRKIALDKMFSLNPPTPAKLRRILDRYCVGCIVTKEEDAALSSTGLRSRMPDDWDGKNPWSRYEEVGIEVIDQGPLRKNGDR